MAKLNLKDGDSSAPGQDAPSQAGKHGKGQVPGQDEKSRARSGEGAPSMYKDKSSGKDAFGPDYGYKRIRLRKNDEVNPYADAEDARHAMDGRTRTIIVMVVVTLVVFFLSATLPTEIASPVARTNNSLAAFLRDFGVQFRGLLAFFTGADTMFSTYLWEIVVAGLAGAALGLSGGVYQGAMKNALASPSTLGVTQGGTLGLIIYGCFIWRDYTGSVDEYNVLLSQMGPVEYVLEIFGSFLSTLVGCFIIVGLIMLIATIAGRGRVTNVSLIIAGQVFSTVIGVVITWIRYYLTEYLGDQRLLDLLTNSQTVSFSGAYTGSTVLVFAIPLVACMVIVFSMSNKLSLLAFSDAEARSMGISTRKTRNVMVAVCTVLTALVVSFAGPIGFVGFMVPHIARRFIGPDFRFLLPASALLGAILVMAVHYISYMGIPGFVTGSTGVFTSILGCVMFIVMALRSRGSRNAEWL